MSYSRRRFLKWAASVSAAATAGPRLAWAADSLRPALLPSQDAVWDQQVWMAKLGPKYTGNEAHTTFVEFLATEPLVWPGIILKCATPD